jgi:site-specific recombinase XerD
MEPMSQSRQALLDTLVSEQHQIDQGQIEGMPSLDSLVRAQGIEEGLIEKGFWENTVDAWAPVGKKIQKIVADGHFFVGQQGQEYRRQYEYLTGKTTKGGEWDPKGEKVISDTMLVAGGLIVPSRFWDKEVQKDYAKFMEENPLTLDIEETFSNKFWKKPKESVMQEMKDHYFLNPDEIPEQPNSFMDAVANPRKMMAALIDTVPMTGTSMLARMFKANPIANAIIFSSEAGQAYDEALEYLMATKVASGEMGPQMAAKVAANHAFVYGVASTAMETYQQNNWIKLGKNMKGGAVNLLAGKLAKTGLKHKVKSYTFDWLMNWVTESLTENAQGTTQTVLQKLDLDKPLPGMGEYFNERGIEWGVMLGMTGPGLPGSVSLDVLNGPVERSDSAVMHDVQAIGAARERERARPDGDPDFMSPQDFHVPKIISRYQEKMEVLVNKVFGKKVVWYTPKNDEAAKYDGVAPPGDPGTIFLSTNGRRTLGNVTLHEVIHQIRRSDPEHYDTIKAAIAEFITQPELVSKEVRDIIKDVVDKPTDDYVEEEMIAEAVGRLAEEAPFMDALTGRSPGTAAKFGRMLRKTYRQVMRKLKGSEARKVDDADRRWIDPYINDMEGMINSTVEALKGVLAKEEAQIQAEQEAIAEVEKTEVPEIKPEKKPAGPLETGKLGKRQPKPKKKKAAEKPAQEAKPEAEQKAEQPLAERPKYELKKKTSDELFRDYIRATHHPDMTPEIQAKLREMVTTRGKIERGELEDVGMSAEEVSEALDKFIPENMEARINAAKEAVEAGAGTVDTTGMTKAEAGIARAKARKIKELAKRKKSMPVSHATQGAIIDARLQELSEHTIMQRKRVFDSFIGFLNSRGITDVNDVTRLVVSEWLQGLGRKGLKASAQNQYHTVMSGLWKTLVQQGRVAENVFDDQVVAREWKRKPRTVDSQKVELAIKKIPKNARNRLRDIAIIRVLFSSGMRATEISTVGTKDISTTAQKATVIGKGNKERIVRFSPEAAQAVDDYVENERINIPGHHLQASLFLTEKGKWMTRTAMRRIIKKHFEAAGIPLTTHNMRHSFAIDMLESGMNLRHLQELMGHANLETTAQYLHLSISHLREAIKKLPDIPHYASNRQTASEKKLKLGRPVARKLWTTELGTPRDILIWMSKATKAVLGQKASNRKGWISKAGDVYKVESIDRNWEHTQQLNRHAVNWPKAFADGLIRIASFDYGRSTATNLTLDVNGLNASNLATVKAMVQEMAKDGVGNALTLFDVDGTPASNVFYRKAQAARAVDQTLDMLGGELKPAVNKKVASRLAKHKAEVAERRKQQENENERAYRKEMNRLKRKFRREEVASEKAWKVGLRDARKELRRLFNEGKDWRKKFQKFVQASLPLEVRGKLLAALADVDSEKSHNKAVTRLFKEMDRLEKAEAKGRLKRWIARFGKHYGFKQKQGYKKGMKFKISTPFSKLIENILDHLLLAKPSNPLDLSELLEYAEDELEIQKEKMRRLGMSEEAIEQHPFVQFELNKVIREYQRLLKGTPLSDLTAAQLDTFLETLDIILGNYEHQRSEYLKHKQETQEMNKQMALGEIASGHKKVLEKGDDPKSFERNWSRYKTKRFWLGLFGRFNYNIQTLVEIMAGGDKIALYSVLVSHLQSGRDREKAFTFQLMDEFQRRWRAEGITEQELMSYTNYGAIRPRLFSKKLEKWIADNAPSMVQGKVESIPTESIVVNLKSGQNVRLTIAEALSLLLHTRNEFNYNALKKGGFITRRDVFETYKLSDEDFDVIRELMPENALKLIPIIDDMMEMQQQKINDVSNRLLGYNLANIDGYWHIRRWRPKGVSGKKGDKLQAGAVPQTVESRSHFKERRGGTEPILIDDAFNELVDTVRVAAEYIGLAEPLEDIRVMTADRDIQKALYERGYGDYLQDYIKQIDSLQQHPVGLDWWEKLYGAWARNITRSVFGLNLRVSAQQYASVMLAVPMFEEPGAALRQIRGKYDEALVERVGRWSPMLRERFMGAVTRELGEVAKTGGVMRFMTGKDQMMNLPTFLVRMFDKMAVLDIWRMAENEVANDPRYAEYGAEQLIREAETLTYEQRKDLDEKRGSDTADFQGEVVAKAEQIIRVTQPTWDVIDRSRIGSVKNPIVKAFTMFHSQREKLAQMIGIANSNYMNRLEQIRRENNMSSLKDAARTKEGMMHFKRAAQKYATVLLNTGIVKAWGTLYGVALLGRDDDPEDWAFSVLADIPGMYYFGDVGRGAISSWGKKLRGKKTYQLGAYEAPPQRVVSASQLAVYETGNLILMTTGAVPSTKHQLKNQITKTLDKAWEAANYAGGLPFNHLSDVLLSLTTDKDKPRYKTYTRKRYKK